MENNMMSNVLTKLTIVLW